jgi:hypothetical protein
MLAKLEVPSPPSPDEPGVERAIGELVAAAAGILCRGLLECSNGGLRQETKGAGGDVIAQLYDMRVFATGSLDFNATAREYGKATLRAYLAAGHDPLAASEAKLDTLVDTVVDIVDQLVQARIH